MDLEHKLFVLYNKLHMIQMNKNVSLNKEEPNIVRLWDYRLKQRQKALLAEVNALKDMMIPDIIA